MIDLTNLIKAATQFVKTHPSHPRFDPGQKPHLDTSRSDLLMNLSHDHAEKSANLPPIKGVRRPSDTEIALALIPALLGQNPKYLGGLMSGYHHTMGEELAHQKSNRRDQQQALMNLAHHYSDASKSARSGELARYGEGERNYRAASSNQRMVDVSANNSKRITKSASGGRLTPEQAEALHQFNKNIQGIAEGPEGWTAEHQTAYIKALAHLRHTPIFAGDPGVLDSHVKSYPVGYKSSKAVILAHDSYHRFLSSIYHAGVVTEMDVKRSHSWLIKNVPEGFRWQFIIPQEGETWQSASQRLNHAEHVRGQKASVPTNGEGPLPPMEPKFDGSEWKATGPIGKAPKGTLPPGRAKG